MATSNKMSPDKTQATATRQTPPFRGVVVSPRRMYELN
jgi:hypothetical protein